jgi:flagellin
MPSVINSNLPSLNTQRNLGMSQASLSTSLQRLSSGLRVNSAKDDAAGLSIAGRMQSQINGSNVAIRNANDATSYAQTAEGALGKVNDALQRMRDLAVQSANGTVTGPDRANLDGEFKELQKEVTRLTKTTMFNGQAVLASTAQKDFQVGANVTDIISVAPSDLTSATNDVAISATAKFSLNAANDTATNAAAVAAFVGATTAGTVSAVSLDAAGKAVAGTVTAQGTATDADTEIVKANLEATRAGLEAALAADSSVVLTDVTDAADGKVGTFGGASTAGKAAYDAAVKKSLENAGTQNNAHNAMTQIDKALSTVAATRANFGAVQNRFDSVISNLQVSVENQTAARSRIMDADFASETANLSRNQILQQAGTAMLAQANSLPNGVLSLLRG